VRAIVHDRYGPPSSLELREIDRPTVGDNQVLVKVHAVSVNPLDWYFLTGRPYIARAAFGLRRPKQTTPGADVAGTVEAVGNEVRSFAVGDQVWGGCRGSFAEYAVASETSLVPKPAEVSFEHAAATNVAALTALQGLRDVANVQPGQRVVIDGASGGVGTFAVQLAKHLGAHVTGVCSARNVEMVGSIGADEVIDYTNVDFTDPNGSQEAYDVVFDNIGNRRLRDIRRVMSTDGVYVLVGAPKGGTVLGPMKRLVAIGVTNPFVTQRLASFTAKVLLADLQAVNELLADGTIVPVIDRTYPLADAAAALTHLETGRARGKIIVTP